MNAAVIYSSKTGTSARCAARLAEHLEADLLEISGDFPDIAAYDAVLLGGGVRMAVCPALCAGGLPFIRVRCCKSLWVCSCAAAWKKKRKRISGGISPPSC